MSSVSSTPPVRIRDLFVVGDLDDRDVMAVEGGRGDPEPSCRTFRPHHLSHGATRRGWRTGFSGPVQGQVEVAGSGDAEVGIDVCREPRQVDR